MSSSLAKNRSSETSLHLEIEDEEKRPGTSVSAFSCIYYLLAFVFRQYKCLCLLISRIVCNLSCLIFCNNLRNIFVSVWLICDMNVSCCR